jgi:hypothetical protein
VAALCCVALLVLWRPVVRGDVYLPLDALLHMHPWRYSYERVPVNNPIFGDQIRQIGPRRLLVNTIVEQGAPPLWNRTVLSGMPMLDDGQLALFYPPSLIFLVAPLGQAFGYYALLQLVLAGAGCALFARRIGLGHGAATLAGVCYMLNGHLLTWLQFPHHSGAHAMLPWCFWAAERACARRRLGDWALAAVPMAMLLFTQIQLAFYGFTGLGCYVLYRAFQTGGWRARLGQLGGFGVAGGAALALAAVQLLPAVALAAQGQRADVGFAPPQPEEHMTTLLRLLFPAIGGTERIGPPPAWGPPLLQVPYPYVGIGTLLLAMAALAIARHRLALFFGALAIGSLLLALRTPLLELLLAALPPYRQFDIHLRWLFLWGLATAVLAAMGAQAIYGWRREPSARQGDRPASAAGALRTLAFALRPSPLAWRPSAQALTSTRLWSRALLAAALLLTALWALAHLQLFTPQSRYGQYITAVRGQPLAPPLLLGAATLVAIGLLRARRLPAAVAWAPLIAVTALDLAWHGAGFNTAYDPATARPTSDLLAELGSVDTTALYPMTRQVAFLQRQPGPFRIFGANYDVLTPNLASAYGLEDIRGYLSLYSARYNRLARMMDGKDYTRTSEGTGGLRIYFSTAYKQRRLLDMLNVRYIIFAPGAENIAAYQPIELVHSSDEGTIYRNPTALPRAWLVHRAEVIPDEDEQLARMARPDFDPAQVAILPSRPPSLAEPAGDEPAPEVTYEPNRVIVRARPAADAILVLADTYYDGWEVEVDGRQTQLYRANYTLRGVWLPAGEHTVTFSYRPAPLRAGAGVSGASLLLIGAAVLWSRRRSREAAVS